jgi:hypothetical protein
MIRLSFFQISVAISRLQVRPYPYIVQVQNSVVEEFIMRLIKPGLRNSISALLGTEVRKASPEALEPVRQAMLNVLGDEGARLHPQLTRKLRYLHDAHALWYARAEMMAALSSLHGELKAVAMVQSLTPAFKGLVPKSLMDASSRQRN